MKKVFRCGLLGLLLAGFSCYSAASDLFIYPAEGQSAEQQDRDKYECYNWAKANSGYDPANPGSPPASASQKSGGVVRGALGGAALGAIAGDSSKAAGRGAAAGALFGGMKQSSQNRQATEQRNDNIEALRNQFNRANAACLEGRGYTVK
jgi:hypothetical protein